MHRSLTRVCIVAGAVAAVVALSPPVADAGINPVTVTGVASCSLAGPVGRITLNWTVTNNSGNALTITTVPSVETGTVDGSAFNGTVTIAPNPIAAPAASTGTGSDGPLGGTSTGTVTLTVAWSFLPQGNEVPTTGSSSGTITLPGNCVQPPGSSSSSTSTTSTIKATTTTPAIVSLPRFTG